MRSHTAMPEENASWRGVDVAQPVDRGQRAGQRRVGQQGHELVAAQAGDDVAGAQRGADPLGGVAQRVVALLVAELVVELLEVVEVERHERDRVAAPGRPGQLARRRVPPSAAVEQAGQVVDDRLLREPLGERAQARA